MSAVAEQPPVIDTNYNMPKPKRGSAVLWFPHANKNEEPEVAFVMKAAARNIIIRLASGTMRESVRHMDDPKLKLSETQRENGAWGFTEETKELQDAVARIAILEARLESRESRTKAKE